MSGRAGRRGLDEKGMVISFFHQEKDLPDKQIMGSMIMSKGEKLESKFKMSYSILFNALSSQIIELEDIMRKSFGENENYVEIKALKLQRDSLSKDIEDASIVCEYIAEGEDVPIFKFKENVDALYEISKSFYSKVSISKTLMLPKFT